MVVFILYSSFWTSVICLLSRRIISPSDSCLLPDFTLRFYPSSVAGLLWGYTNWILICPWISVSSGTRAMFLFCNVVLLEAECWTMAILLNSFVLLFVTKGRVPTLILQLKLQIGVIKFNWPVWMYLMLVYQII